MSSFATLALMSEHEIHHQISGKLKVECDICYVTYKQYALYIK